MRWGHKYLFTYKVSGKCTSSPRQGVTRPEYIKYPTCCGEVGRVILLIASVNIYGKEQMSIWAYLLLSFRSEKELLQPKPHFPPQLYTTIGLIKMNFICLQKKKKNHCSGHFIAVKHTVCYSWPPVKGQLLLPVRVNARHMLQPSEHCCRSLHIVVF